jgi:hypothetical protein
VRGSNAIPKLVGTNLSRTIESCFRQYLVYGLEHYSENSKRYISSLSYTPSNTMSPATVMIKSPKVHDPNRTSTNVTLQVLTPAFYKLLVISTSPSNIILSNAKLRTEQQTFYTSSDHTLATLFTQPSVNIAIPKHRWGNKILSLQLYLISVLRGNKEPHPLDRFVYNHLPFSKANAYLNTVLILVFAKQFLFDFVEILDALRLFLELNAMWWLGGVFLPTIT